MSDVKSIGEVLLGSIAQGWIEQGIEQGRQQGFQQGLREGLRRGLLEGIAVGLRLRFGVEGLRLLPELAMIEDADVLSAVHAGLPIVGDLTELRRIYQRTN